tara:strand:+ start:905 stop:2143 length:1239 start_codon:yes stop_codon:yes gene_type:complete
MKEIFEQHFYDSASALVSKKSKKHKLSIDVFRSLEPFLLNFEEDTQTAFTKWTFSQINNYGYPNYVRETPNEFQYITESILYSNDCPVVEVQEQLAWIKGCGQQHEQRTPEWFAFRANLISASTLSKIFGTESLRKSLLKDKLISKSMGKTAATEHGVLFEPVAQELFEIMTDSVVSEYGCIQHRVHKHVGASPDGIVTSSKNPSMLGRMLEIKCPYSREICGLPKYDYWVQVQIQLEVCDLEYCDFFECEFDMYYNSDDFFRYLEERIDTEKRYYGITIESQKNTEKDVKRTYSKIYGNKDDNKDDIEELKIWYDKNINETIESDCDNIVFKAWTLRKHSRVTIQRNRMWFDSVKDRISNFWDDVIKHRTMYKDKPEEMEKLFKDVKDTSYMPQKPKVEKPVVCLIDDDSD